MRTLLSLAVLWVHALFAQEPFFTARRFGVEDGLLHRRVNAIAQDADGFLWIATPSGMHRFDGHSFKPFTEAEGLGRSQVMQIWTDASGLLWLVQGSLGDRRVQGIDLLDPRTGRITAFRDQFGERAPVRADELFAWCSVGADSSFALAAPGRSIRYHPREGFTVAPLPSGLALCPLGRTTDGTLLAIAHREGEDSDLLVRCTPQGVLKETLLRAWRIERAGSGAFHMDGTPGSYVRSSAVPGQASEYWVPLEGPVKLLSADGVREFTDDMPRLPLSDGMWCVRGSVRRMADGDDPVPAPVLFDVASVFPDVDFHVHHLFRDRAGHVWIGAEFGLYQLTVHAGLFQRLLWSERIPQGHGRRVRGMALVDGRLHVNAEREGFWTLDERTGNVLAADTAKALCLALASDGHGGLWRSRGDSLFHVSAEAPARALGPPVLLQSPAWSVLPVEGDALLVGCEDGVWRASRNGGMATKADPHPALGNSTVVHLMRDRANGIWACTSAGLFRLDGQGRVLEEWSASAPADHRTPTNDIRHVYEDAQGVFWIGTGDAGLLRWDRGADTWSAITRMQGLPSNGVYAVFADGHGRFWMPTDNGLVRYAPATGAVKRFTTADGIAHNEFNRLAYLQAPDGRLFFGGLNGITVLDPARFPDEDPDARAPFVISAVNQFVGRRGILVDRTAEVRAGAPIVVRPGDRYFTVAVALLHFGDPSLTRYAWRVEGIDADWNEQHEPVIRSTELPFGEHVLRVRAQGPDGVWLPQELTVPIEVVRPFYLRWYVITAVVLLLMAVFYALFRYRLRQLRRTLLRERSS